MDYRSVNLNDLNQTQPDCAAILENAMTLTTLLPGKLSLCSVEIKISSNFENHTSQSTADSPSSLFKGESTRVQLQCCEECLTLKLCQVDALHA